MTDLTELRTFIAERLRDDLNRARGAGHGFGHLPLGTLERDATQPDWTRLDFSDNLRPTYDLRFANQFTPDWIADDVERKLELAVTGDEAVLLVLASSWAYHRAFDPAWARTARNGRQLSDDLDVLAAVPKR